jgi:copper chaperone
MTQIILNVPDISCNHCKMSIEGAVNELSGVDVANVDVAARTVDVSYDTDSLNRDAIVTAIEEQGYEVAG